jgi:PTH1 family peptidyl-tRNA hydrolase
MNKSEVKLIVGLGNPTKKYERSRHNAGFMALEHFCKTRDLRGQRPNNFKSSLILSLNVEGKKVILAWPQTYMNLSGHAVRELIAFYKVKTPDLLVIHDEMDLAPGVVKASKKGGVGHNGIDSIKGFVSGEFARFRIGIGRPPREVAGGDWSDYVLNDFTGDEWSLMLKAYALSSEMMEAFIKEDLDAAQRLGNKKPKKEKKEKDEPGLGDKPEPEATPKPEATSKPEATPKPDPKPNS